PTSVAKTALAIDPRNGLDSAEMPCSCGGSNKSRGCSSSAISAAAEVASLASRSASTSSSSGAEGEPLGACDKLISGSSGATTSGGSSARSSTITLGG